MAEVIVVEAIFSRILKKGGKNHEENIRQSKTKVLEGINLLALKLTARSANLACDWLYFQDEEPDEVKKMRKF